MTCGGSVREPSGCSPKRRRSSHLQHALVVSFRIRYRSAEVDRIALAQDERVLTMCRVPVLGSSRLAGAVCKRWCAFHSTEGLFCWAGPRLPQQTLMDGKSNTGHATGRRQRWQIASDNTLATTD